MEKQIEHVQKPDDCKIIDGPFAVVAAQAWLKGWEHLPLLSGFPKFNSDDVLYPPGSYSVPVS